MNVIVLDMARATVLDLLLKGKICVLGASGLMDDSKVKEWDELNDAASGYLAAAQAVMFRHGLLHNELIEHPNFVFLRKWVVRSPTR